MHGRFGSVSGMFVATAIQQDIEKERYFIWTILVSYADYQCTRSSADPVTRFADRPDAGGSGCVLEVD